MRGQMLIVALVIAAFTACRPSDVLSVPAPTGVLSSTALQNQGGAEGAFNAGKAQLFGALDNGNLVSGGFVVWSGMLADEFTFSDFTGAASYGGANIDARMTAGRGGFIENADFTWASLLQARSSVLIAIPGLMQYEPASGRSKMGEAFALAGYAEVALAEGYCAGTTVDNVAPGGAIQYGTALTTDSLLGVAEAHFDSAVAHDGGDALVEGLAKVGLGRALLDRGQYAAAAAAVAGVPSSFVYNGELEPTISVGAAQNPNLYALGASQAFPIVFSRYFNVAEKEGQTGLNFVSAHDARLVLDTTSFVTPDGNAPWRLPMKFEADLSFIPLATGIEAQLIAAEAALKAGQTNTWLADLNTLRNSGFTVTGPDTTWSLGTGQVPSQTVGLRPLSDPGTDSGRVSLMFRERAFWLFGTGTRLGDLRRLMRQYGRDQSVVFPTGPYANGNDPHLPSPMPNYGTDVNLTLPTPTSFARFGGTITNPNYRGCITSTNAA